MHAARKQIAPLLPGVDERGRPRRDHRQVIDRVLWRRRTGRRGVTSPGGTGPWQTVCERFCPRGGGRDAGPVAVRGPSAGRLRRRGGVDGVGGLHDRAGRPTRGRRRGPRYAASDAPAVN
ncbi:transposase [Streptomyces sp. NPDC001930]|uniref:transposase n=1 Tax=Streptomyces sp. NPDC001930 TaxID=3364625 RepID=UPI0036B57F1B